jgi:hypothetical protein
MLQVGGTPDLLRGRCRRPPSAKDASADVKLEIYAWTNDGVFTNPKRLIGPDIQRSAGTSEIIGRYD